MSVLGVSIMTSYIMHIYAQAYIVMCLSCQGGRPEWLSDVSRTVIFPDIYDSRTDDFPDGTRRLPDRRSPDTTLFRHHFRENAFSDGVLR